MKNRLKQIKLIILVQISISISIYSQDQIKYISDSTRYISSKNSPAFFPLSTNGYSATLFMNSSDYIGVKRALNDLKSDIGKVTGQPPLVCTDTIPVSENLVIVGTLGKSPVIDRLAREHKINVKEIEGKWETFLIQTVTNPFPGIKQALVVVGSDKRGTIYGIYDISSQIGVSPWSWWADVPVKQQKDLFVIPGRYSLGEPKVKYRGIFLNDEAPALSGWVHEKFGNYNHQFYEKVFELILRLKGNFLWPAMWGNAFNDDDKLNPQLADDYGIVMSTSHHEPMMRAQQEWKRYGSGPWNYEQNDSVLKAFWRQGIKNMGKHESIITIGMRGDGDMPMSEQSNISLLERIVRDQRNIIQEVTGKNPEEVPQVWALYKEVQEYYEKGMRVPDDVTLLLCDDNWGNLRKLPKPEEKSRPGGYGIYYHFDYVGGPRNYKWLNTNQIQRVWEQMHLAYEYGVDRIWIVNVGDLKPMEFPISFFLDYAWNPEKMDVRQLQEYTKVWAKQQFGNKYASDIADILTKYTQYNSRRKPELLSPDTYSLINYREAETIVSDYNKLAKKAENIYNSLPSEYKDAYYQLVLFPVKACANLNEMYLMAGKNHLYAKQGRAATNDMADRVKNLFNKDKELAHYYNKILSGGKWDHMMDQTHISYRYWQQPMADTVPAVKKITLPSVQDMGIAIEGSDNWWPNATVQAVLPSFDVYQKQAHYFEIFNRGTIPFNCTVKSSVPWLNVSFNHGKIDKSERVWITVDWNKAPADRHLVPVTISSGTKNITLYVEVINPKSPKPGQVNGFMENDRYISMEAEHYSKAISSDSIKWVCIPDLGRTLSGMTTFPVISKSQVPVKNSPHLEYMVYLRDTGDVNIQAYFSPTLNFTNGKGLKYAVSIDGEKPQIINIHANNFNWGKSVSDNIKIIVSHHKINAAGEHIIKFWMVDPALVLQKIVLDMGGVKPSYLGPPESFFRISSSDKSLKQVNY